MKSLWWVVGGIASIGVGLTIWATAFVLVPLGIVLIAIGMVKTIRAIRNRPTDGSTIP